MDSSCLRDLISVAKLLVADQLKLKICAFGAAWSITVAIFSKL
jgi:hypothetical protein